MISRSSIRERSEVCDIGLKSVNNSGEGTLGLGKISALFHCVGTRDSCRVNLKSRAIGVARNGAPILYIQYGTLSGPGEVGFKLSRTLHTRYSLGQLSSSL